MEGWCVSAPGALARGREQSPHSGTGTGIGAGPRPVEDGSLPGRELP